MDNVKSVLESITGQEDPSKSIQVHKEIELDIDEGMLLASDYNPCDTNSLKTQPDEYLKRLTRDNVQLLFNKIWTLPTERVDNIIVGIFPKPQFILPRSRKVPKQKALTKWEQFRREKNIRSKKKGRPKSTWDEMLQKWVPIYGYKRVKANAQKEWLVEVNDGNDATPSKDAFATANDAKVERVAKNKLQRLHNLARAKNVKLPKVGLPSSEHFSNARQLSTAVTVARASTASVGKFQQRLPKEKDETSIAMPGLRKKRKEAPLKIAEERERNMNLADSIVSKNNRVLSIDSLSYKTTSPSTIKKGSKKKTKQRGKGAQKPKAGNGKRNSHSRTIGRKRR